MVKSEVEELREREAEIKNNIRELEEELENLYFLIDDAMFNAL